MRIPPGTKDPERHKSVVNAIALSIAGVNGTTSHYAIPVGVVTWRGRPLSRSPGHSFSGLLKTLRFVKADIDCADVEPLARDVGVCPNPPIAEGLEKFVNTARA
jgi:hypothetical protein